MYDFKVLVSFLKWYPLNNYTEIDLNIFAENRKIISASFLSSFCWLLIIWHFIYFWVDYLIVEVEFKNEIYKKCNLKITAAKIVQFLVIVMWVEICLKHFIVITLEGSSSSWRVLLKNSNGVNYKTMFLGIHDKKFWKKRQIKKNAMSVIVSF